MRIAYLLFLVPVAFSGGCAGFIAGLGTNLNDFETIEQIHAKFGEPDASGSTNGEFKKGQVIHRDAMFYEDYAIRRKIADTGWCDGDGYAIEWISSLGTIDLLLVPQQLFIAAKRSIMGQRLRIIYDSHGRVVGCQIDGEDLDYTRALLRDINERFRLDGATPLSPKP